MKKIAFIDLGSNSIRFIVIAIDKNNYSFKLIHQQKESIRLSEGLSETNNLSKSAIKRALFALNAFAKIAKQMDVPEIIAVATAAVRLADNRDYFLKRVYEETGIKLKCISGEEEARYGFLGVINTMNLKDFVLFDLGGASIEVTLVKNRKIRKLHSFPMGALTLTEKFKKKKELRPQDITAMKKYILDLFSEIPWLKNLNLPLVGIGGTVRNIGKMDQRSKNYPIHKLHNYELSKDSVANLLEVVSSKTLQQRKKISGLSAERADIIIPGMHIVKELMDYTNSSRLFVSGCGLREGLFYDYYGEHYRDGNFLRDDVLINSAENYLYTLKVYDLEHIAFVRYLAKQLYDLWQPLHNSTPRMKKILDAAAILHDTGKRVNFYSHARHSAYIALNAPIYGLSHHEQALCAFIAGFSHGNKSKMPKSFVDAQLLSSADWKLVRKISIILTIAEALDESYEQGVLFLKTKITDDNVILEIHAKEGTNLAVFSFVIEKVKKHFYKEYKRNLVVKFKYQ